MLFTHCNTLFSLFYWWINISAAFLISFIFSSIITPRILLISFRKRLFDPQNDRKLHHSIVPRLGGIAFLPLLLFSVILLLGINLLLGRGIITTNFLGDIQELAFGFCAAIILYLTGVADDLIGVRYRTKFAVQTLSGIMLALSGLWINNLHGLFGLYLLPPIVGYLLTVIVVVFIINAINLIDGIDGLASGLSCIALFYYGLIFMQRELYIYAILSFASLGSILPFLYYNVFGNTKRGRKLFMGDTGSLTIGIILSILSIAICIRPSSGNNSYNSFIIAFAPLIIPCFDVLRVFLHRLRNKKAPFAPDKNHIHHKLLGIGMHQHRALTILLLSATITTAINVCLSPWVNINVLLLVDILVWTLLNIWLTAKLTKKRPQTNKRLEISNHHAN